jgi:hypothetical protein
MAESRKTYLVQVTLAPGAEGLLLEVIDQTDRKTLSLLPTVFKKVVWHHADIPDLLLAFLSERGERYYCYFPGPSRDYYIVTEPIVRATALLDPGFNADGWH